MPSLRKSAASRPYGFRKASSIMASAARACSAAERCRIGPSGTRIVQSWDVAMMTSGRNDYSTCSTWLVHKNDAYLIHVYRGRLEYPDLRRKVIGLAAEHRAITVLIEDPGPGMNLLQDLRATMPGGMTRPIGVKAKGSKVDRTAA
jgi:phage terminase large subunit-like protein